MGHFYRWSVVTEYVNKEYWPFPTPFDTKKEALECIETIKNGKEPWIKITLIDNKNKKFMEALDHV